MRNNLRARRLAFTALCAGTSLGAAGLAIVPSSAFAAKVTTVPCSDIWGSGSTLQTPAQQGPFATEPQTDGAFKNCQSVPHLYYNYESNGTTAYPGGGTGSGGGQGEFALKTVGTSLTPADSSNGSWLDGFVASDAPVLPANQTSAANASGADPEFVPILQAPVAIVVHLPANCSITKNPIVTNADLLSAWENKGTWQSLLTDAGAKPTGAGCNTAITLEARFDSSGTTYAFRQYLSQLSSSTYSNDGVYGSAQVSTSNTAWPAGVTVQESQNADNPPTDENSGSAGVSDAVELDAGTMGYVNAADAAQYSGFAKWKAGSSTFWVEVQNNGYNTAKVTGAEPTTAANVGNCYATYTGALPTTTNEPDYSNTYVANPKQKTSATYPLCTLTYDIAWKSYSGSTLAPLYTGNYAGETASGVAASVKDYFTWLTTTGSKGGQGSIPTDYSKLPANILKIGAATTKSDVATS